METHKVYDAEILKKEGDYVRVKMTADYYGNKIEKIFTLYGNSPLLEVQFALTFRNPEANVIGPQPILELGARHWTEDVFTIPEKDGIHEYRMKPEKYYGRAFFMKEGWNAGYDTEQDITFVGAFPVTEPSFPAHVDEPSFKQRSSLLLCGIPAMDTNLPEEHNVLLILPMGSRRTMAEWSKRIEGQKLNNRTIG